MITKSTRLGKVFFFLRHGSTSSAKDTPKPWSDGAAHPDGWIGKREFWPMTLRGRQCPVRI